MLSLPLFPEVDARLLALLQEALDSSRKPQIWVLCC